MIFLPLYLATIIKWFLDFFPFSKFIRKWTVTLSLSLGSMTIRDIISGPLSTDVSREKTTISIFSSEMVGCLLAWHAQKWSRTFCQRVAGDPMAPSSGVHGRSSPPQSASPSHKTKRAFRSFGQRTASHLKGEPSNKTGGFRGQERRETLLAYRPTGTPPVVPV